MAKHIPPRPQNLSSVIMPLQKRIEKLERTLNTLVSSGIVNINSEGYVDLGEISLPSAPSANTGRLFVRDNGSGKSQLVVRFASGAEQVISTQP
jgi:hypothetical protein